MDQLIVYDQTLISIVYVKKLIYNFSIWLNLQKIYNFNISVSSPPIWHSSLWIDVRDQSVSRWEIAVQLFFEFFEGFEPGVSQELLGGGSPLLIHRENLFD